MIVAVFVQINALLPNKNQLEHSAIFYGKQFVSSDDLVTIEYRNGNVTFNEQWPGCTIHLCIGKKKKNSRTGVPETDYAIESMSIELHFSPGLGSIRFWETGTVQSQNLRITNSSVGRCFLLLVLIHIHQERIRIKQAKTERHYLNFSFKVAKRFGVY